MNDRTTKIAAVERSIEFACRYFEIARKFCDLEQAMYYQERLSERRDILARLLRPSIELTSDVVLVE